MTLPMDSNHAKIHETTLVQRASGPNRIHTGGWGRWSSWNAFVLPAFTDYTLVTFHWAGVVGGWWAWNIYTYICTSIQFVFIIQTFELPKTDARRTPSDEPLHRIDASRPMTSLQSSVRQCCAEQVLSALVEALHTLCDQGPWPQLLTGGFAGIPVLG